MRARCVPGALASSPTSSEFSKLFTHSTALTSCCVLCARLPPLVFFLHTRRCTRARSCATPQSSRRTTDGWCARFRARSGRRLHRRRALRLGRGASPTRSNARPLLLRPVCMPLLLALTQRVLAARRPGVPAACYRRRSPPRPPPMRAVARRRPTCSRRLSPRHRVRSTTRFFVAPPPSPRSAPHRRRPTRRRVVRASADRLFSVASVSRTVSVSVCTSNYLPD